MWLLGVVIVCAIGAIATILEVVFGQEVARIPASRRGAEHQRGKSRLTSTSDTLSGAIEGVLKRRGWVPFPARDLELAGVKVSQSSLVIFVSATALVIIALGGVIQHPFVGLLLAIMVPAAARLWIKMGASRRQRDFGNQLESTMQIMSSALRAGHSFPRALDTVSRESDIPTSEEFTRIINENRLGRDLIEAMRQTGERMKSEDFGWVTDAVAIQRDTGGNLSEVLDQVGTTIRERNELKQQIHSLSAEGRISGAVMMGLPIFMAAFYSVLKPGYLSPLVNSSLGLVLLGVSGLLYVVGALWMRALVSVKF